MRSMFTLAALGAMTAVAAPAAAQIAAPAAPAAATAAPPLCPAKVTDKARKALIELQTAVNAKDAAKIATAEAAARAAVKTGDDKCVLGQMQLKAAVDRNDHAAAAAAVDALIASGVANQGSLVPLVSNLGKMRYNAKDYSGAATAFEKAMRMAPNDPEPVILLAEARAKSGQVAPALELYGKAFALRRAGGGKVDEPWLKRAVAFAYEARNPQTLALTRDWVSAYPSAKNWRDALKIYAVMTGLPNSELLDIFRLQRATKSLVGESDFARYATTAMDKGLPGEAKAMLDEGFAAGAIARNSTVMRTLATQANAKAAGDRASLTAGAKAALASPAAKLALTTGDAFFGYGDYAKAAELYRAALTKSGADAAQLNLRLGIALAMSGDKAGATAALNAVTGAKADIAKYWLIYLGQRA